MEIHKTLINSIPHELDKEIQQLVSADLHEMPFAVVADGGAVNARITNEHVF